MSAHPQTMIRGCALLLLATGFLCACGWQDRRTDPGSPLIDATLSQWDQYLSYIIPPDYNGSVPVMPDGREQVPIGLNPEDNKGVFRLIYENETPVIRVSGEYYGALISKQSYKNYHLSLKVRWGDKIWPAREGRLADTGILYHSIGEPGVEYYRSWMLSQEFQIMDGHMGDYWNQASSAIDIRAYPREYIMSPVADKRADWLHVGAGTDGEYFAMRSANHESPRGEWTQLDLICVDGKSLHIVNGEVVMILKDSRYLDDKDVFQPLSEGKIQLQSEASEVFFKDITIRDLDKIPTQYTQFFD